MTATTRHDAAQQNRRTQLSKVERFFSVGQFSFSVQCIDDDQQSGENAGLPSQPKSGTESAK